MLRVAGLAHQVLNHSIFGLVPGKIVAPAFTVRGERILGGMPKIPGRNPRYEMFRRMPSGAVVVIASGGYDDAVVFGENVALALQVRGCKGIVADGGVRDRDAMVQAAMPIYGRFATPLSSGGAWSIVELGAPVILPGQTSSDVRVHSGDIIMADGDGVLAIPRFCAATVAEDAAVIQATEGTQREELLAGKDPEDVYAGHDRFGHVRRITRPVRTLNGRVRRQSINGRNIHASA